MENSIIAIVGGAGAEGKGIALRLANAGHHVVIGSRDSARAAEAAAQMRGRLADARIEGMSNEEAVAVAGIVILAVPYSAQVATVERLQPLLAGKILVDVTVPLVPPAVARVSLPDGGSAVEAIQKRLGEEVRVVAAFQNVSSHLLDDLDHAVECDVLVCADDKQARETVAELVHGMGLRAVEGGVLANSAAAEALTSVLIAINRRYKVRSAGIRITGLPDALG